MSLDERIAITPKLEHATCADEPIHRPGAIQPYGVLLVLEAASLLVTQASDNCELALGKTPESVLNQKLAALFEARGAQLLERAIATELLHSQAAYRPRIKTSAGSEFDAVVRRHGKRILLELLPPDDESTSQARGLYHIVRTAVATVQRAGTVDELCELAASEIKRITGFDRVMMYRFDEDWNGEVIAEAREPELESWLGLHYPASDIPAQARELYRRNWLRIIVDVEYEPAEMVPRDDPETGRPLDMSDCALRSVSPVHIQYLKNMGVGASMSISVLRGDRLWGLIACHHRAPRYLDYETRAACELLGRVVSVQLPAAEIASQAEAARQSRARRRTFTERMQLERNLAAALVGQQPNLLDLIPADGLAIWNRGDCLILGEGLHEADVGQFVEWLDGHVEEDLFHTDSLSRVWPEGRDWKDVASGVLAVRVSRDPSFVILWTRREVIQTVKWGGDPNEPGEPCRSTGALQPRRSFEVWKETVRERSLPWESWQLDEALELRTAIVKEELARVNDELTRSNAELDSFAYVASHDLKEPLRGISNYAHFLLEDFRDALDAAGQSKLETIIRLTQRMETLLEFLLHYSRVGRTNLHLEQVDLNELLAEALEAVAFALEEKQIDVRIPRPLPRAVCDRVRLGEVLMNLLSNAIKYNDKKEQWIEIGYLDPRSGGSDEPVVYYVRDNGIGIREKHRNAVFELFKRLHGRDRFGGGAGAGLTIVKRIIDRHGGRIWFASAEGGGTTFYFTLQAEREGA